MKMHTHTLASLGLLSLALASCALGPNYKRMDHAAPAEYRPPDVEANKKEQPNDTSLANMPWWTVFRDPQLQELIRTALANNQDLKAATARVEEARSALGIARAAQLPGITANGNATRQKAADVSRNVLPDWSMTPERYNSYSGVLDLSYEIDLWGRVRRSKESALNTLLSTGAARQTVISSLITGVAQSYFTLLELDSEALITSNTLHTRQETLKLMELKRNHGIASDLEVSQFRAEVAASRVALSMLKESIFQCENALSILVGKEPGAIQRGLSFHEQPPIPNVPAGLPSELLERRPDVVSAERDLAAATARIGVAKAAFFPSISLTANAGYAGGELNDLIEKHNGLWAIAGNASQPIFQGGSNWFNFKATKARREQSLQNYRKTILQALREVSDSLEARQRSTEQRQQREEQVASLREAVRLSQQNYDTGQSSYLDLLDAERQLYATESQLEQARLEELLSCVRLYKALGGGLTAEGNASNGKLPRH